MRNQIFIAITSCVLVSCVGGDERPNEEGSEARSRTSNCILRSSIRGYTVLDESNLILDGAGRRKYHVGLQRRAYGLKSSQGISFDTSTMRICAKFDVLKYEGHFGGSDSVRIALIRELSPEEHEDLLIQFGKKEPEIEQTPAPQEVKGAEVEELDPAATDDSSGN